MKSAGRGAPEAGQRGIPVGNKTASFGEIVWDVFGESKKTLGGAPLNFAYFCSKFGCDSAIILSLIHI